MNEKLEPVMKEIEKAFSYLSDTNNNTTLTIEITAKTWGQTPKELKQAFKVEL